MTDGDPIQSAEIPPVIGERRDTPRRHLAGFWNLVFHGLRVAGLQVDHFYASVGVVLIVGILVAIAGTLGFAELGEHVRHGATQAFDVAVLHWMEAHHTPAFIALAVELTYLGTGTVVLTIVGVAALFLWHTAHRHSARLLLAAVAGNLVLNGVLKLYFDRPRPSVFAWRAPVTSSSFPSGHAMSATVCYGMVAYLVARLQKHEWSRALTLTGAVILILSICATRVYLGVHYPSDVIAGMIVGLAWAGFCVATLEASLAIARRRAPRAVVEERRAAEPL